MSKNFIIPENERIRNRQAVYSLNEDALEGLRETTRNNQPAMALRYVMYIADILEKKLTEIDSRLAELDAKSGAKTTPKPKAAEIAAEA